MYMLDGGMDMCIILDMSDSDIWIYDIDRHEIDIDMIDRYEIDER